MFRPAAALRWNFSPARSCQESRRSQTNDFGAAGSEKGMKVRLIVFLVVAVFMAACGSRGPAYKDINTNQQAPPTNPGTEGPAGQGVPNKTKAASPTCGPAAAPPTRKVCRPAFIGITK